MVRKPRHMSVANRILGLVYFCLCMPCAGLFLREAIARFREQGLQPAMILYGLCFAAVGTWGALAALGYVPMFLRIGRVIAREDQNDVRTVRTQNAGSRDEGEPHVRPHDETA